MKAKLKSIYLILIFTFLYGPILVLTIFSFNNTKLKGQWVGFTLKWYKELLHNEVILTAMYYTISIAILATLISTILGTIAAIGFFYYKKRTRLIALNLNYLPILNPDIVTAISLMVVFNLFNLRFGFMTLLLSHITFCAPYVVLSVLPKLKQMNHALPEAAMDLGANEWYTLRHIILPEIKTGIITGALLSFTLSLDDFVVSFFTTGHGVNNLSVVVYSMAKKGINPAINAISTIMFATILILLIIINKRSNVMEEI